MNRTVRAVRWTLAALLCLLPIMAYFSWPTKAYALHDGLSSVGCVQLGTPGNPPLYNTPPTGFEEWECFASNATSSVLSFSDSTVGTLYNLDIINAVAIPFDPNVYVEDTHHPSVNFPLGSEYQETLYNNGSTVYATFTVKPFGGTATGSEIFDVLAQIRYPNTPTPTNTATATGTNTSTPTVTNTPGGPTSTPTATGTNTSTPSVTPTPGGGPIDCGQPSFPLKNCNMITFDSAANGFGSASPWVRSNPTIYFNLIGGCIGTGPCTSGGPNIDMGSRSGGAGDSLEQAYQTVVAPGAGYLFVHVTGYYSVLMSVNTWYVDHVQTNCGAFQSAPGNLVMLSCGFISAGSHTFGLGGSWAGSGGDVVLSIDTSYVTPNSNGTPGPTFTVTPTSTNTPGATNTPTVTLTMTPGPNPFWTPTPQSTSTYAASVTPCPTGGCAQATGTVVIGLIQTVVPTNMLSALETLPLARPACIPIAPAPFYYPVNTGFVGTPDAEPTTSISYTTVLTTAGTYIDWAIPKDTNGQTYQVDPCHQFMQTPDGSPSWIWDFLYWLQVVFGGAVFSIYEARWVMRLFNNDS